MYKMYGIVLLLTTLNLFTKSQLSLNNSSAEMLVCVPKYGPCSCEQEGIVNCNGEKLETVNLKIANDNGVVVEQLNMQENMLTKLRKGEVMPHYEKQLMRLDLRRNLIHQIEPAVFSSMINLHDLLLSNNKLTELESSIFDDVDLSLRNLDLSHNLLESIDNSPFENLHLLLYLYLDDNPLKRITNTSFEGLSSLLELSMENTKLSFIPEDAFKSLNHLEVLSLRNNQLETVPQLNNLNKLNRLVLSGNPILRVNTYAFQLYPNLENIQLRHMPQLTLVEDCAFCTLNHLNTIAITDSPLLKWIDPFAFGSNISLKYNLKIVDFSNNNLQSLDKELLPWENVTEIQLANNSFKCDASLNWIFDIRKTLRGNINCNQKNDFNGNFTIFKKDNSCCSKNSIILFSFPVLSGSSCGIGFSTEKVYGGFICLPSKLHFFICIKILQLLMIQKNSLTLIMMFHHGTFNYTKKDFSKFIRWQFNSGGA
ncbi:Leucine-rich repeat and immunoglobulin-like domain-containing nogo receptor-interacting protein 1 [Trichinella patagoniensis]|uniref:Leucine-rich repeat and immunoglobulin-like domain-containing nogo receptor-interacting protein 1 n=1 Tax=Trichinella patagoniensis TaxID=990121 RepID=A0A0V0Z961_9BILA|nr:Leucine-rich repeat and immunoglobulin-like domain-containing nogo receptor-interacting protein 1 [Trichinella patagoniensis]